MKKKLVSCLFALLIAFATVLPAYGVYKQTILLPENQVWTTMESVSRTKKYSNVMARCHDVYATNNLLDLFSTIHCRIISPSGSIISDIYYLRDTNDGYTYIYLAEGYIYLSSIKFQFCGNSSLAAYAIVSYYGR